jgi:hypothetical protein
LKLPKTTNNPFFPDHEPTRAWFHITKNEPQLTEQGSFFIRLSIPCLWDRLWEHPFQDDLKSHRMAATTASVEEIAIALPHSILELNCMRVVLTLKCHLERFEVDSVTLLSVALRLVDLTDHPIIHLAKSPSMVKL